MNAQYEHAYGVVRNLAILCGQPMCVLQDLGYFGGEQGFGGVMRGVASAGVWIFVDCESMKWANKYYDRINGLVSELRDKKE